MSATHVVSAQKRSGQGSGEARRLRKQGIVPGVIYGQGKSAEPIQVARHDFERELRRHASENVMVDLAIEGADAQKVLIKDVQHHPLTGQIVHVDFHSVSLTEKIRVTVAVELVGEPIGVSVGGGTLENHVREIEVDCLPSDIPAQITVEVSQMEIGDSVMLRDLDLGDGVSLAGDPDVSIAHLSAARVPEEDEIGEAEEGVEGAEEGEDGEGGEGAAAEGDGDEG